MLPATWILGALLHLASAAPVSAEASIDVLEQAWGLVRDRLYDDGLRGVDWERILRAYRPLAAAARTRAERHAVVNRMLGELGVSHLALLEAETYRHMQAQLLGRRIPTLGLQLVLLRDQFFVWELLEGGPAEAAGIGEGDRLVAIDDVPVGESDRLLEAGSDPGMQAPPLFGLRASLGEEVRLLVQPRPEAASRREVVVTARAMSGVDAWRQSLRFYRVGDRRLAFMHLWYMAPIGLGSAVRDALAGELASADGLILDLRGRGGFDSVVEELLSCFRGGPGRKAPVWRKPVVLLIDERTRSAKELFAYRFQRSGLGLLVGRRTEGAVLGAHFVRLQDGSYLMYPATALPLVDGVDLEGRGVVPDVEVDRPIEYAGGEDPVMAAGIAVLVLQIERSESDG
ncbi:MAG: S41 family peptidase [Planctomycetota bacterium]